MWRSFSRTMAPRYGSRGPQDSNHPPGARQEPWWQQAGLPASGGTQPPSRGQQWFQPRPPGKEVSHRRCPPRGTGRQGGGTAAAVSSQLYLDSRGNLILLQKDVIMRVEPSDQLTGFYSLFPHVKKDGGLHPILDPRCLNAFIKVLPFKMLTTSYILEAVEKGDWFTSVDLRDTYFYVPICPDHRPFLCFALQGQAYQFKVLPFGLSLSPRVFTSRTWTTG